MSQNVSTAVMQRRHEAHDSLDFFPTPAWATRALCEHVIHPGMLSEKSVLEPACGEGHMAKPLAEYFKSVEASDIAPYGFGAVSDFLMPIPLGTYPDWVITNPPFRLAQQFIEKAQGLAAHGVAVILRTAFLEGIARYKEVFSINPPSIIAQFSERVSMFKGRVDASGSSATAYCWLVWMPQRRGTDFVWIPPCRRQLERVGDYA